MKKLNERIKKIREELHLSQEYVAKYMNLNRTAISQIESGNRKVSAEELKVFSELFGITADELINGNEERIPENMFVRSFEELDEADKKEIMNLIKFKKMMKEKPINNV
ncbi:MAG: helix-turn-helix transcriptional regulator [Clostridia bacterium]|nr:helix-turn-helix transcriptional regulator [Clostridia bacterium]